MSPAVWPETLPRPTRSGWQAQDMDPRLKRKADKGLPGYRRGWSNVARQVSLMIKVERSEKAVFDNFLTEMTGHGSGTFYMPDPTTEGWAFLDDANAPLLTEDGTPIELSARWLCLFGDEMPRERIRGVRFEISFSVSVMP
ncbi:hypothetical protein [Tropicibacter sp. Alg240-R139]|uniref:hypothetical protein n=1 Tax=Tropicibacter sp. Alg240-R139 TaxID=2305991 RepID=UPI0013DEED52|nr:hypothetical protein [Tropicibacter sp. Alg240-R139]